MRKLRAVAVYSFVLLLCAAAAHAVSYVVPQDRVLAHQADAVVVGSALTSYAQRTAAGGIETVTVFSIEDVISGVIGTDEIDIHEPGGAVDNEATIIPGVPRFAAGKRVILLLLRTPQQTWSVLDIGLGRFTIVRDLLGHDLALRDSGEINGWDVGGMPHVERPRLANEFIDFLRTETHGGIGREDYFLDRAPLVPVTDSVSALKPIANTTYTGSTYTAIVSGSQGARWFNFPSAVTFYTLSADDSSGSALEPGAPGGGINAVQTALGRWTGASGANINYTYSGTKANLTGIVSGHALDGFNEVLFEADLSPDGAPPFSCSTGGVLGEGGIHNAISGGVFNSENFYQTTEGDVSMNKGIANCTALFSNGDFNTAVTHEIGHTLGLRHSDQTRADNPGPSGLCTTDPSLECSDFAVMKSFIPNGINAVLQTWDVHAADALYPGAQTCTAPQVTSQPQGSTITSGGSTSMTVAASGTATLTYQWYIGASGNTTQPVNGATSTTLNINGLTQTTSYWCQVTNNCGTANSNAATVTVTGGGCTQPQVTQQPQGTSITSGGSTSLTIAASGTTPLSYQWYVGSSGNTSQPVNGATSTTLNINGLTQTTSYWCQVINACGSANSNTATVMITAGCTPPSVTTDAIDQSVTAGSNATLVFGYAGTAGIAVWYQGVKPDRSTPVGSATQVTVGPLTQTTTYWAEVTNNCGSAQTRTCTITVTTVCTPPAIISAGASAQSVSPGTSVNLSVTATGTSLTYQWYKGQPGDTSNPLANGTTASVSDTPPATTTYWVQVTNGCGSKNSNAITVVVNQAACPTITINSISSGVTISSNTSANLAIDASGGTLHYQWYAGPTGDTSKPVGTDSASYVTPALFANASYWVKVSNDCGNSSLSSTVAVTVIPAKHRASRH